MGASTEVYDAWQGQSRILTSPVPPTTFDFRLPSDSSGVDDESTARTLEDGENRLVGILAAQVARREKHPAAESEEGVALDESLPSNERREVLQKALNMAASNGDVDRIRTLVSGRSASLLDINARDEEGTAPLIYASCFGHQDVVEALLGAGADINVQDRNQWSPLMWAMTNRHKAIAKLLLDHGASTDAQSSTGRTAFDFVAPHSEMSEYLQENGYGIGSAGVSDDFYDSGFSQDKLEEEMAENELKRRMMMESAMNLEVDLSSLGLDEQPESPDLELDGQDFVWDRCLNDQMFVFQESELRRILDIIVTNMTPQRSPSQKPVPANVLFLSARYAYHHASRDLLTTLLTSATEKINDVVERHQWDMTILAFWISNATLLLYYMKKDTGLVEATTAFQLQLAELINEIFILIIRDAERRMDKHLDAAMLDHETIPGFEDVHFQNEWRIFRSKPKVQTLEPAEKRFGPPSPKRRAQASPRNITSLLSSTLFVLDLYDIHSFIIAQVIAQLFYWLGAELFNRIISNRKYLARTKAMQIRMNISTLEDWARANNRQPEHYETGSTSPTAETLMDASRRYLAPVVQLLQWLQCFSSLGDDFESLVGTIQQLPRLSPYQLIQTAKRYRPEVGEKGLSKGATNYLASIQKELDARRRKQKEQRKALKDSSSQTVETTSPPQKASSNQRPVTPHSHSNSAAGRSPTTPSHAHDPFAFDDDDDDDGFRRSPSSSERLLLDPALMLPFSLPTSTDMLVSFGAGIGGVNRERERKYIPTIPPDFLIKLDSTGGGGGGDGRGGTFKKNGAYGGMRFDEDDDGDGA